MITQYRRDRINPSQGRILKDLGMDSWAAFIWANGDLIRYFLSVDNNLSTGNINRNKNSLLPEGCSTANLVYDVIMWLINRKGLVFKINRGDIRLSTTKNPERKTLKIELLDSSGFSVWKCSSRSVYPLTILLDKALMYLTIGEQFTRIL